MREGSLCDQYFKKFNCPAQPVSINKFERVREWPVGDLILESGLNHELTILGSESADHLKVAHNFNRSL